ncbi:MAG: hypothetical protein ABFC80_02930 [Coriobacteriales bacterium]
MNKTPETVDVPMTWLRNMLGRAEYGRYGIVFTVHAGQITMAEYIRQETHPAQRKESRPVDRNTPHGVDS